MHRPAEKCHLKSLLRHSFGPFSNYIWRCLNVIKICAGWTGWAQITAPKWLEKHASLTSILIAASSTLTTLSHREPPRTALTVKHLRSASVKTGFPCKFMKTRAEVERRSEGKIREAVMVGGNGREPQFCVSVCVRPLPRKTRPERCWDLISAWRHGRKLVPRRRRGGLHLHVLPEKWERDLQTEQESSSLSTSPAMTADAQSPFV